MKKCSLLTCTVPLELQEFNKNKSKKDGLNSICKICSRIRSKQYYKDNTNKHKKNVFHRNRDIRHKVLTKLYDYLSDKHCLHCKETDPTVLEFDHLRDKCESISRMIGNGYGWEKVKEEIDKCQILCANCHRKKTAIDQKWFVVTYLENKNGRLA